MHEAICSERLDSACRGFLPGHGSAEIEAKLPIVEYLFEPSRGRLDSRPKLLQKFEVLGLRAQRRHRSPARILLQVAHGLSALISQGRRVWFVAKPALIFLGVNAHSLARAEQRG